MSSVQFLIGKTMGKYRVLDHLGHGGMAEVYKGIQEQLDRLVAIKVLHPFLADEEGFVIRFQREARIVATLRHSNIVQVYDFDHNPELNIYYMVMEYIDGPTLKSRMSSGPLPPDEVARIGAAIADALAYAHQRDMVHRDIKPANIMFTSDGEAVLTDFGIAKMMSLSGLTASGAMVGTPAYIAPEVGMGRPGIIASDIYSLGVVLYEMAAGRLPFESESPMGMVMQHINDPPPPSTQFVPDIPAPLERIILHAMEKKPEARFGSATEMASAMRYIVAGKATLSAPTPEMLRKPETPPPGEPEEVEDVALRTWAAKTRKTTAPPAPVSEKPVTGAPREVLSVDSLMSGLDEEETSPAPKPRPPFHRRLLRAALVWAVLAAVVAGGWIGMGRRVPPEVQAWLSWEQMTRWVPALGTLTGGPVPSDATPVTTVGMSQELSTPTQLPVPTMTASPTPWPTVTPLPTSTSIAAGTCPFRVKQEKVQFSPGQTVGAKSPFIAYITLRNTGSCLWPEGLQLVFVDGRQLEAPSPLAIAALAPGETTSLLLPMVAPEETGDYAGQWEIRQADGAALGSPIRVEMTVGVVDTPTPTPKVKPTAVSQPEPLVIGEPELVEWHEDVVANQWYATVRFQARGGSAAYRYYHDAVLESNLSSDGTVVVQMRRCANAPLTMWVTSGNQSVVWEGDIDYPAPESCQ